MPPVLRGDHPAVRACRELFLPDGASDEEIAAARQGPLGSPLD
jgi:hypothetical protein